MVTTGREGCACAAAVQSKMVRAGWMAGRPRKESCGSAWEMLRNCESKISVFVTGLPGLWLAHWLAGWQAGCRAVQCSGA